MDFWGFLLKMCYFGNIFVFFVTHYVWMFSKLRSLNWPGPRGYHRYPKSICPRGGLIWGSPLGWPVGFKYVIILAHESKNDVMYFEPSWTIRGHIGLKPRRGHEMVYPGGPCTLRLVNLTKAPENMGCQLLILDQKWQKWQMSGTLDWTSRGARGPFWRGFA